MSVGTCCVPGTRAMPGGPAGGEDSGAGGSSLGRWPGLSCVWQGRPRPEPGREEWVMASLCRHVFLSCIKVGLPCSDTGSSWGRRGRAGPGLGRVRTPPPPHHTEALPLPRRPLSYSSYLDSRARWDRVSLAPQHSSGDRSLMAERMSSEPGVEGSLAAQP